MKNILPKIGETLKNKFFWHNWLAVLHGYEFRLLGSWHARLRQNFVFRTGFEQLQYTKVGQTEKVWMYYHEETVSYTPCDDSFKFFRWNNIWKCFFYIKGLSILIRIDNFVRKLEKCPTFGPIILIFFYGSCAMCPTLGKQVHRSDNKVFSIFKSKTYYRDIKTLTYGVFML